MLGYVKLKNNNQELYETNYLEKLKAQTTKIGKLKYFICYWYYELIVWIKNITNIITIKQIYHAYIIILPFSIEKIKKTKLQKCMKKVQKLIKKYQINTLVIQDKLEQNLRLEKENLNRKIHILDGKGIIPYMIKEILEYMMQKQNTKTQLEDLYFCINEPKSIYIENINYLSKYFKTINIITPKISNFQKIANKIEQNENSMITVTNNRKKSLKKAKFIINFDFTEEQIKSYSIYRRAILILLNNNCNCEIAGFDGIQIKNIGIDISQERKEFFQRHYLLQTNSLTTLYESILNEKQGFNKVKEQIEKDQVKLVRLYGSNGVIGDKEYANLTSVY